MAGGGGDFRTGQLMQTGRAVPSARSSLFQTPPCSVCILMVCYQPYYFSSRGVDFLGILLGLQSGCFTGIFLTAKKRKPRCQGSRVCLKL